MSAKVPTFVLAGIPESTPVAALKDAHTGGLAMEKLNVAPLGPVTTGAKEYGWPACTEVGGLPAMVVTTGGGVTAAGGGVAVVAAADEGEAAADSGALPPQPARVDAAVVIVIANAAPRAMCRNPAAEHFLCTAFHLIRPRRTT
jgi:hypothetical protein